MVYDLTKEKSRKIIPLPQALIRIFLSVVLMTGSCTLGILYHQHLNAVKAKSETYNIRQIVQISHDQMQLTTSYLEELLDLSIDQPKNLYELNTKKSKKQLLSNHFIRSVDLKKRPPDTLYIDYSVRRPVAILSDYKNTLLDKEFYLFSKAPLFFRDSMSKNLSWSD